MSRQELERQFEELQEKNRKLKSQLTQQTAKNRELQLTLREAAIASEVEEENITNGLLRRLDSLHREKDALAGQLIDEERKKNEQETLLEKLMKNRQSLERHLRREEVEIRERLEKQLERVQRQRREMQEKVTAEATTLQQLHDCVKVLQEDTSVQQQDELISLNRGSSVDGLMSSHSQLSSACASPVQNANGQSPPQPTPPEGRFTPAAGAVRAEPPTDDAMIQRLEGEIAVAEALRMEAVDRALLYQRRIEQLQREISDAEREREMQRSSVEIMRQELSRTTSATHEIVANQEVVNEWMIDRELLIGHQPLSTVRSSSVCSNLSTHTVETVTSELPERATPRVLHKN